MGENMNEMLTVKEWAEKAGIKLFNYDGFTEIYSRLANNPSRDFEAQMADRFVNAGELLCTRRAFEARLDECTMGIPKISDYERMAEVIPEFAESTLNLTISATSGHLEHILQGENETEVKTEVRELLELMKLKSKIREKSIEISGITEETETSELNEDKFSASELEIIKRHEGTLESLEEELSSQVIQRLEDILEKDNVELSEMPLKEIDVLRSILYSTARQKALEGIDEEFMYVDIPGQKKDDFIKTFSTIDGRGIKSAVAFDIETDNGRIKGTMPTTPKVDAKIRGAIGEDNKESLLSIEETSQAMQVIDNEVSAEERKGLMTRIKEFTKKIFDRIKGRNEGR